MTGQNGSDPAVPINTCAPRILLIEDDPAAGDILSRLLKRGGYDVVLTDSVANALEAAAQSHFHLVISDLELIDGSGLDLMRQLRVRDATLPGIALSGHCFEEHVRNSMDAGFSQHLVKPVEFKTLLAAIRLHARKNTGVP